MIYVKKNLKIFEEKFLKNENHIKIHISHKLVRYF